MRRALVAAVALLVACGGSDRVVVAAGTTLVDSGVLETVVGRYERETGAMVAVTGVSSQTALALAGAGEADLVITHHPTAEEAFLADSVALESVVLFRSEFVLLAPADSAFDLGGLTLIEALQEIADRELSFVARGDGSGTAAYEEGAWEAAGVDPSGESWYAVTGLGMGDSLLVAAERGAVTLSELGAFLQVREALGLERIALTDVYANPYRVTLIDEAARDLYHWLVSAPGVAEIEAVSLERFGSRVHVGAG